MAKIFYVTESAPDYSQVNFFKTEKEALEYGISQLPQFDMYGDPMNDEEADGEEWYKGDSLTFKKGILFSTEEDVDYVQAIEDAEAREYAKGLGEYGGAIFFEGFQKGMYGYLGRGTAGKGIKWDWDGYDINESTSNDGLKYVKLFEQFVNEALNPKKHMYGEGSGFRKYAADLSELEGEAAATYKKYSKYIGKSIEFNQHTDTYDGVPKEIADGGSKGYHFRPEAFEILDVTIITDLDKFHPFVSASPKKMEKKGYEKFLVGMVVAVRDSVTHTAEISAPPAWFEKNVKFK
jgi:hypothetical protein